MAEADPPDTDAVLASLTEPERAQLRAKYGSEDINDLPESEWLARMEAGMAQTQALLDKIRRLRDKRARDDDPSAG